MKPELPETSPSEDEEFFKLCKARNRRRLRDRWRCRTIGHFCCFTSTDSVHVQLTDEKLEEWAQYMDAGSANLVAPPENVVPSQLYLRDIQPLSPGNTVSFKRPFRFTINPSMTDLRSWDDNLSLQTSSLGPVGAGYFLRKLVNWIGRQVLGVFVTLDMGKRIQLIKKLIGEMEKEPVESRGRWLENNQVTLLKRVGDLLELSSDKYGTKYQAVAAECAGRIRMSLLQMGSEDESESEIYRPTAFWFVSLKLAPLDFLREDWNAFDALAVTLREILLQEDTGPDEWNHMVAELIECACSELGFDRSPSSRQHAYEFMQQASFLPAGRKKLEFLARPGGKLEEVARHLFNEGVPNHPEQACGVRFFVAYANDHPAFRDHVTGPNGLAFILRLKMLIDHPPDDQSAINWKAISWICRTIRSIVRSPWLISALLGLDLCKILVQVLMFSQRFDRPEIIIDYWIICAFRDLMVIGGEPGSRAVQEALSDEARRVLQKLNSRTTGIWDDWMVDDALRKIPEILGED